MSLVHSSFEKSLSAFIQAANSNGVAKAYMIYFDSACLPARIDQTLHGDIYWTIAEDVSCNKETSVGGRLLFRAPSATSIGNETGMATADALKHNDTLEFFEFFAIESSIDVQIMRRAGRPITIKPLDSSLYDGTSSLDMVRRINSLETERQWHDMARNVVGIDNETRVFRATEPRSGKKY